MQDEYESFESIFDQGFEDPFWTLEQAIVWIVYRNSRIAGGFSKFGFALNTDESSKQDIDLWYTLIKAVLNETGKTDKSEIKRLMRSAYGEIRQKLRAGRLVATWKWQGRERAAIPKLYWVDHWIKPNSLGFLDVEGGNPQGGSQIRLDREDVLKLWPAEAPKMSDEKRATKLLKELMEQSLENPTMTRDDAIEWARNQVRSLGVKPGLRAWRAAVKQAGANAWSKAGPRSRANRTGTPT